MKVTGKNTMQPGSYSRVEATRTETGYIMVSQGDELFHKFKRLIGSGIANIEPATYLPAIVVNFTDQVIDLLQHQFVSFATKQSATMYKSDVTHGELLWLINEKDAKFRKRHTHVRDIEIGNRHLGAHKVKYIGADKTSVTRDDIDIDVKYEVGVNITWWRQPVNG